MSASVRRCASVCIGVRRCASACISVHRCASVCRVACLCARVHACTHVMAIGLPLAIHTHRMRLTTPYQLGRAAYPPPR